MHARVLAALRVSPSLTTRPFGEAACSRLRVLQPPALSSRRSLLQAVAAAWVAAEQEEQEEALSQWG
mgnify:CR=1 FL=1